MRVIGYTYEADCHCVACTKKRKFYRTGDDTKRDENDIPYDCTDREGNPIHPIFSTDEMQRDDEDNAMDTVCGDCGAVIQEA